MNDAQDALRTAVDAALTEHAEMHGAWVLTYEEQRLDPIAEDVMSAVSSVGDGSPAAQLGLLTTTQRRCVVSMSQEDDE